MSTTIDESTTQTDALDSLRERRAGLLEQLAAMPVLDLLDSGEVKRERNPELERELVRVDAEIAALAGRPEFEGDLEQTHAEAEASRSEADEAERARVVAVDRAVQTYDLETIEWHLNRLDPDDFLTAEAWRVWERRRIEVVNQPVDEEANQRRHLAGLKARRVELQERYFVYDQLEAAGQLVELDKEIEECEARLGMVGAPPVPPDPIDIAVDQAQREIEELEARRGPLALAAFADDASAVAELAELDERWETLKAKIRHGEAAKQERARVQAEQAQAQRTAEYERLTRQAAEVGRERDRAFAEVVDTVENLVPTVKNALEIELRAQAAARAAGAESVPNHYRAPLLLVLSVLQHEGLDVNDIDVPGAQWRAKLIETWRRPGLRCSICNDPAKAARAAELAAGGATHAAIATEVGASKSSIQRHLSAHVKEAAA